MKKAYIFPGQGAQFTGMGLGLYQQSEKARYLFEQANHILGFEITKVMFEGTDEELKQTNVTQPAIFLHSVILAQTVEDFTPDRFDVSMVAGHSLGEFSALVAAGALSFEDGLRLVAQRASAMQKACELNPSTMAAVLGLPDETIERICLQVAAESNFKEVIIPANYNCPGQVVISGSLEGVRLAGEKLKEAGAKRVLPLQVGGAFHSPLMEPARAELAQAISTTPFSQPRCPIYQNVNAKPATDVDTIKANLIAQLTAPVRWTQSVEAMGADGATVFIECGPGKVLQGLVKKILPTAETQGVTS
ncbi:[acyl-carrier-protein] S-malonyltransferase [Larkinella arboricola]|uniref:Malonyl CoA-acyl carrier protein transacylase n=1 Tax=Larkinella arboricola TaxID=643671 RepID=A0A327X5T9_LARAB|nr:ACP S-malonyltransferase [Larkinella arboricola]RAK02091.1 [acyl-carrier-protein] S-malonyltransferase [Larkinella arboricola]